MTLNRSRHLPVPIPPINDLSPGQYVGSAGQFDVADAAANNNGMFYRNSRIGLRDITDGPSLTLMVGERSRNVSDSTWVGAIPGTQVCTNPSWPVRDCEPSNVMVLAHTGPSPETGLGRRPQLQGGRGRRLLQPAPRRLQLPLLRRLGAVRQGDGEPPGLQLPLDPGRGRGRGIGSVLSREGRR